MLIKFVQGLIQRNFIFLNPAGFYLVRLPASEGLGTEEANLQEPDDGLFSIRGAGATRVCEDKAL